MSGSPFSRDPGGGDLWDAPGALLAALCVAVVIFAGIAMAAGK